MTISLKIRGKSVLPKNEWRWAIDGVPHVIPPGQQNFEHTVDLQVHDGWNTVEIQHSEEDHNRLHLGGHHYSFVNITGVYIDGVFCRNQLLLSSGSNAQSTVTKDKQLFFDCLGEPFRMRLQFYQPLEHWTFAVTQLAGPESLWPTHNLRHDGSNQL